MLRQCCSFLVLFVCLHPLSPPRAGALARSLPGPSAIFMMPHFSKQFEPAAGLKPPNHFLPRMRDTDEWDTRHHWTARREPPGNFGRNSHNVGKSSTDCGTGGGGGDVARGAPLPLTRAHARAACAPRSLLWHRIVAGRVSLLGSGSREQSLLSKPKSKIGRGS